MRLKATKGRTKRQPWWAITHSRDVGRKTYHYLNVAGKRDRAIVVTTSRLDVGRGAFAMCVNCVTTDCDHARFVAECLTMGVTTIGEERHRDSAPPPAEPPADLEQWRGHDEED